MVTDALYDEAEEKEQKVKLCAPPTQASRSLRWQMVRKRSRWKYVQQAQFCGDGEDGFAENTGQPIENSSSISLIEAIFFSP